MMGRICDQEPRMLEAASIGTDDAAAVQTHLAACASCREAVEAVRFMRRLVDTSGEAHALPDPGVIWWKAQLLRRWQAERRAAAPIERMHWVELAAGLASLAVFLGWQWSGLAGLLAHVNPIRLATASSASASAAGTSSLGLVLMLAATVALGGAVFAGLNRRLTE